MIDASISGDQVWVVGGTYPLSATLTMKNGVNVYGGFYGNETSINARQKGTNPWDFTYPTILHGQNARQVLNQPAIFATETTWDGVTITGGEISSTGAGVYLRFNGRLFNCIVTIINGTAMGTDYEQYFTITVSKAYQPAPSEPTLSSKTSTSITLNTVSGCEYNINYGGWQSSPTFTGLTPNTSYTFAQRKAETATYFASTASPYVVFITEVGAPPVLSGTVTIFGSAVFGQTLTANTSALICNPSGPLGALSYQWKSGTTNISTYSSTYTLEQADIGNKITVTVTAANCTGSVTSTATATVTKATQTAPATPTMESKTATSIILKAVTGCEYRRDNGNWQTSTTFSGLTSNTSYSFTQRKEETATYLASAASAAANFTTAMIPVINITNVPTKATIDVPLTLIGTVVPNDATYQTITWSLVYPGTTNAMVQSGKLYTSASGTAVVKATITHGTAIGTNYTQEFNIEVGTVGIEKTSITDGITIYPNPTTGELTMDNGQWRIESVEIFDVYGRKLLEQKVNLTVLHSYALTAFPAGLYFVKIQTEAGVVVRKVLKE